MSYDLMVFEPSAAPQNRTEFMKWYEKQTEWAEDHSYEDHSVASPSLQAWFKEMIQTFPPMNGPLASDDDDDNPRVTDYCIGHDVIYCAFAWSLAEEAFQKMRELSVKHCVGFFDASSDNGEILFPDGSKSNIKEQKLPWWKFWQ